MGSAFRPNVRTYKCSGTIAAFSFVKFDAGSSGKNPTIVNCGTNDGPIGISQNDASMATGNEVEVALPGGGALLSLAGTVALGNSIKSNPAGAGVAASTAGDRVGAYAVESGVSGDIIGVHVIRGEKYNADAT